MEQIEREKMTPEEKKQQLYEDQKQLLEEFLAHGAISQAQFDKSLGDLTEKMGMKDLSGNTDRGRAKALTG